MKGQFHSLWAAVAAVALAGCAGRAEAVTSPSEAPMRRDVARRSAPAPAAETASRTIVTPSGAYSVRELYEQASTEAEAGRWERAAGLFERIVALDPEGPLTQRARFQAGVALDNASSDAKARERALSWFLQVREAAPEDRLGAAAAERALRLAMHLERWATAEELARAVSALERGESPSLAVLARAALALAALRRGELAEASSQIEHGLTIIEENQLDRAGRVSRDVAALYFARGELKRVEANEVKFVPPPEDFAATLELRCQLLLDAQRAYSDVMRAYDAHWSAMAGVQTSELYLSLHQDLLAMPAPRAAHSDARRALFEGAMRLRYAVLLEKGLGMIEHTLAMVERTGEPTSWTQRARQARDAMLAAKDAEDRAISRLPYSREELKAALEELKRKVATGR